MFVYTCVKLAPHVVQKLLKTLLFVCATFVLVCAVKNRICAVKGFKQLNFTFSGQWRHSAPHTCPIFPKTVSIVCAMFVLICAVKRNICATTFFKLFHFIGYTCDVTQPPINVQIFPKWSQSFVLCLCWFVPSKETFVLLCFLRYYGLFITRVTSPAPHQCPNLPKIVSIVCATYVLICAVERNICATSVFHVIRLYWLVIMPDPAAELHCNGKCHSADWHLRQWPRYSNPPPRTVPF